MKLSRRFINFASYILSTLLLLAMASCKGRTLENVEPTGDTVEVVIAQDTENDF